MKVSPLYDPRGLDNLLVKIRDILTEAQRLSYCAISFAMVQAYWKIGQAIVEQEQNGAERADYGKFILKEMSSRLTEIYGKGYSESQLRYIRLFYKKFPIVGALCPQLTWSHYRKLITVDNEKARTWYMNEAAASAWSVRQLDRQINSFYYERLLASRDKQPVIEEAQEKLAEIKPEDFIKDPYVLEFLDLKDYPSLRETDLEKALVSQLQDTLLELGRGFCFVARQKRMRFDDEDFYLDLVFYHSILKCHVLIDLKIGQLTHQDVGQMDSYIRMFDDLYKNPDDNPTIGILLCSKKNEAIARYSVLNDAKQIFASKYQLTLPTEEELQHLIEDGRKQFENQNNDRGTMSH